jgi:tetratricopeptide (TPR) repeat protein
VQDDQGAWVEGPTLNWETLPAQVEGIIGERIGRLPLPLQTLLTIAAVEGETFTAEVIAGVQGSSAAQVIGQLSNVLDKQHGLVHVQEVQHLPTGRLSQYRFRHYLFQKYLYQRLDAAERAILHEAVGQALVQCYGQESTTIAPQLARHFELAGQKEMALTYLRQAGDTAVRLYANSEAANYYSRALALATPATTSTELIRLFTHFSPILGLDEQYNQALAAYTTLEQLARQRGDQVLELAAVMAKLPIYAIPTPLQDPTLGHTLGQQALRLARTLHDQEAEAKILWNLSVGAVQALQLEQAIAYGEESLALARRLHLMEQTVLTLTHLGFFCYLSVGRYADAETALSEANTIWGQLSNLPLVAHNLAMLGIIYSTQGKYEQALAICVEARQIAQQSKAPRSEAFSTWAEGYIYWEQGDVDRACQVMTTCTHAAEQAGNTLVQVDVSAGLTTIYFELGAFERGSEIASTVVTIVEANEQHRYMPIICSLKAKILAQLNLRQHHLAEAEHLLAGDPIDVVRKAIPAYYAWCDIDRAYAEVFFQQQAYDHAFALNEQWLAALRQFGIRSRLPYALHMQGKIHLAQGDRVAAHASWQAARAEAEALGSRWALWQILASLAQIEEDADQAAQLRQEAQVSITYIADHISDAELRTSFLSLPAVRAVAAPRGNNKCYSTDQCSPNSTQSATPPLVLPTPS